jgi:hypothetical protein
MKDEDEKKPEITNVRVYLDDNVPEDMDGIIRIGGVETTDSDGNEKGIEIYQELVDNAEFHSEGELIKSVATRLGVNPKIVEIVK